MKNKQITGIILFLTSFIVAQTALASGNFSLYATSSCNPVNPGTIPIQQKVSIVKKAFTTQTGCTISGVALFNVGAVYNTGSFSAIFDPTSGPNQVNSAVTVSSSTSNSCEYIIQAGVATGCDITIAQGASGGSINLSFKKAGLAACNCSFSSASPSSDVTSK